MASIERCPNVYKHPSRGFEMPIGKRMLGVEETFKSRSNREESWLMNKEKLEEIAITTVNAECSAIIMNKVPKKLEIFWRKFLIPYDPFSGQYTTHYDDPSPSSSPVKTSDNFVKFADELAPLNSLPPGNDDSTLKKDLHEENFQEDVEIKNSKFSDMLVFLNTPLSTGVCFAPEEDNDEIDMSADYCSDIDGELVFCFMRSGDITYDISVQKEK
ncbi:hypothetical protein Tco_1176890 [Tanacetum coccineum]